jgi:hypothetical protein
MQGMDQEFLKFLASLGVGGCLAGFIYFYQRQDARRHADEWKGQSQLLTGLIVNNTTAMAQCVQAIAANTEAVDELRLELQQRRYRTRDSD